MINNLVSINYPSVEATKQLIESKMDVKIGSPLEMTREQAVEFLENLMPELQDSYFAVELRKKWSL